MTTIPANAAPAPEYALDRAKIAAISASLTAYAVFAGKILLALPLFALMAVVFALHLILPSEKHW
jgi:hypothetical protein